MPATLREVSSTKPITPPPRLASMPMAEAGRSGLLAGGGTPNGPAAGRCGVSATGSGSVAGGGAGSATHRRRLRLRRRLGRDRLGNVAGGDHDDARLPAAQRDVVSLAVAEDHDSVGLDAATEEEVLGGLRALLAQALVRRRVAVLVRVTFQPDGALLAVLQPGRDAGQGAFPVLVDLVEPLTKPTVTPALLHSGAGAGSAVVRSAARARPAPANVSKATGPSHNSFRCGLPL